MTHYHCAQVRNVFRNMCHLKVNRLLWIFSLAIFIFVMWCNFTKKNKPVIVWWTKGFPGEKNIDLNCGKYDCLVTSEKLNNIDGYLFYGSNLDFKDLPLPRSSKTLWGLFHEESPKNVEVLMHEKALSIFNYSSTFSRHSNVPLVLQYLEDLDSIKSIRYYTTTKEKNRLLNKISPVLYLHSDCETMTERDDYVSELMNFINVDSYGKCLNNKQLPDKFKGDYLNNLNEDDFLSFVSQYKFTVAIENGVCHDYITEKLWRPLIVGSIPLYYGSPTISDWLPNPKSAILLEQYRSPKDLANYLNVLLKNDTLYDEFLEHKITSKIGNQRLLQEFETNPYVSKAFEVVDDFECFVCKKLHENIEVPSIVNKQHYNCPEPSSLLSGSEHSWFYSWKSASEQAEELYNNIVMGKS